MILTKLYAWKKALSTPSLCALCAALVFFGVDVKFRMIHVVKTLCVIHICEFTGKRPARKNLQQMVLQMLHVIRHNEL